MPEIVADNISIVQSNELESFSRIEAEYYRPQYLTFMNQLKKIPTFQLNSIAFVTDGIHASIDYDDRSYIRCLSAQYVKDNFFDLSANTFISENQHRMNIRTSLKTGDVILSSVGTIGNCAVVTDNILPANADRHVAIIRILNNKISPFYLSVFLNSKYGKFQTTREATGNVQLNLFIDKIKKLTIPYIAAQNAIGELANKAFDLLYSANLLYSQAETLLLEELGIRDIDLAHELCYEVNSYDSITANRIDAEYYQPKYEHLISAIRKNANSCKDVKQLCSFNARGSQPIYSKEGNLKVINSKHILEQHLDYDNFELTDKQNWEFQKEARVFEYDILIYTTGANVGRTNIYLNDEQALASNHVNILRLREGNSVYVSAVLNSIIGRLQTRRLVTGSAQVELYPSDINKFVVPFISVSKQEQIAGLIVESFFARRRAKALLEEAKKKVEEMIEKGQG
jgi:restriction endonuclease S subunit